MDAEIPTNFDTINIEVQEVSDFEYMEERQEVEINEDFTIAPIAIGSNKHEFTNCTSLFTESSVRMNETKLINIDSSFKKVNKFLRTNHELASKKLTFYKVKEGELDKIGYYNYSNFGICRVNTFSNDIEGLYSTKYYTVITKRDKEMKTYASKLTKIYVYSHIFILFPVITDEFTKNFIKRENIIYMADSFILHTLAKINIKLRGGIIQW